MDAGQHGGFPGASDTIPSACFPAASEAQGFARTERTDHFEGAAPTSTPEEVRRIQELERRIEELQDEIARLRTRHLRPDEGDAALGNALTEREVIVAEVERLAKVGSWVWDLQSDEVAWSSEMYRVLGREPGQVRPTIEEFFAAIHPDDIARVRARSQESSETGMTEPGTRCRVVRRDGSIGHLILIGSPIRDASGKLVRLVGAALDVTEFVKTEIELRRTAELLNQAQQIAGLGSWIWHIPSDSLEWSDALCSIVGIDPQGVLEADNGLVALEVMATTPGVDLVLTDITMPKLDGIALARRLRAQYPRLRLLLMSGFPDADALGVSQDEFGEPLLAKPFTLERLLVRVRSALDKDS